MSFWTVFEQSKLGNKIIAPDLTIIRVNQALATMLGYERTELEGSRIINYAHPDHIDHWRTLQKKLWNELIPSFQIETVLIKKDGCPLWCRVTSILFSDQDSNLGYTILEDICIQKEWETLQKKQRRLHEQKILLDAVFQGQVEERRRIAESLHNGIGQILYATKLNLEQASLLIDPEPSDSEPSDSERNRQAYQAMKKAQQLLTNAITETRRVSHELAPVLLLDHGLGKAIEELCSHFAGTGIELHCYCLSGRLPVPLEIFLYQVCRELVNNVFRHSGATKVRIELYRHRQHVYLEVQDNGKGMASHLGKDRNHQEPSQGLGLRSILAKVEQMEGTLLIESILGKGTLISVQLPFDINA